MSQSPGNALPVPATPAEKPHAKRIRLSLACNQCRKRKVRCDANLPKCRHCVVRNEVCEATNPRDPLQGPGVRAWATRDGRGPENLDQTRYTPRQPRRDSYKSSGGPDDSSPHASSASSGTPRFHGANPTEPSQSEAEHISWVSRAYRENVAANRFDPSPGSTADLVLNTDDTSYRVKFVGGSSLQCLFKFVDLHLAHKGLEPAGSQFKDGMRQSEEFPLPIACFLPDLPPVEELHGYVNAFFDHIWPLFPVVDRDVMQGQIDNFLRRQELNPGSLVTRLTATNIPFIVAIYVVVAIGADEVNGRMSETSTSFMTAAYSLYAHLMAIPYIESVQALILLAIGLRGQTRDGQAWQVIGQAIRIAHSIGLHKETLAAGDLQGGTNGSATYYADPQMRKRLWYSCYSLEKLMQLESGRPSIVDDRDPSQVPEISTAKPPDYFNAWVSLSIIIGQIWDQMYSRKTSSALDFFTKIGKLDKALVDWKSWLQDTLRIGQEGMYGSELNGDGSDQRISSFLNFQFCVAHMTLLRASLIFPHNSYITEAKRHPPEKLPYLSRLLAGAEICTSAARATITQSLHLADQGVRSVLLGSTAPFMASAVLALSILRQPARKLARADLELLNLGTEFVEDFLSRWVVSESKAFITGCSLLRERVNEVFRRFNALSKQLPSSHERVDEPPLSDLQSSSKATPTRPHEALQERALTPQPSTNGNEFLTQPFDEYGFDELWTMLGSDFIMGDEQMFLA